MACAEDGEVIGFEEGMSWLPSQVLDEAFSADSTSNNIDKKKRHVKNQLHQQQQHYRPKLPAETLSQHPKNSSRAYHRPKYPTNWASRGSGMQAIFLESGPRSCGTGVFLPQSAGTNFQSTRKPACSPVLLPSRVVQALNLNVHELGLQISPRKDFKSNYKSKSGDCNSMKNKSDNDVLEKYSTVISQNQNSSTEIFLPKEWTY